MLEQSGAKEWPSSTGPSVLVVGGGLAGMQASLLLAAVGVHVYLVDRAPTIGGHQPLLDKTFPTDSCGLCFMAPQPAAYCPFVECERSDRILVLPSTEVVGVSGQVGSFSVRLLQRARGVDLARCTGCGRCSEVCPVAVRNEFGGGLELRKAIYRPFVQAVPDPYLIDWSSCTRCGECARVCPADAIDLSQQDVERTVRVGAIILATGFKPVDGGLKTEFGHGIYPNVVTSIQLERMLSYGSASKGAVVRPSDGAQPERVAFIQCVGSRDPSCGRGYCSAVCCMYAAKQAALLTDRVPGSSAAIFQMELRAVGKGYDRYVERLRANHRVEYRRSAVAAVKQLPESKDLLVSYVDEEGKQREERFSLVVLSLGMEPSDGVRELAAGLGVPVDEHGFLESARPWREETPVPGVFVAGGAREPADVADTVAEAAAAACSAARLLLKEVPAIVEDEENGGTSVGLASGLPPRVGVLLCGCGGEIGRRIDLQRLAAKAATWPEVGHAAVVDGLCRPRSAEIVREVIEGHGINRLVVAACARRKIEQPLSLAVEKAGLSRTLLELTNLREQCAWVHEAGSAFTEAKAEILLSMAVAKAALLEPVAERWLELPATALVVGGGVAGLVAATSLAEHGIEVWLAERESELGGELRRVRARPDGALLEQMKRRVESADRIHVMLGTEVASVDGHLGAFESTVVRNGREERLSHSVVLLATGVEEALPGECLLGEHPAVMTLAQLQDRLAEGEGWVSEHPAVAMVLCAGSLEDGRGYCSRTCCSEAVAGALRIKELNPGARVYVLHREIRTYGLREQQYEAARRAGVLFMRYDVNHKPTVAENGSGLSLLVTEQHLGRAVRLDVDALALVVGVRPRPVSQLARSLGVGVDRDGFLIEANVKTRTTQAVRPGVFLCGSCQSPKSFEETVVHAKAAAMRAVALLRPGHIVTPTTLPMVNERICSGCGLCVGACAYGARTLDPEQNVSKLIEVLCQGCGACAAACPNGATQQAAFTGKQMVAVLDAALD